jgi:hypothetical protein
LGDAGQGVQRQRVHLGDAGRGEDGLYEWFNALSERLKRVRVCCGDWTRVLSDSVTTKNGLTGIVLDPPYTHEGRNTDLYNHDHVNIASEVRQWAVEHGDNPLFRIAYMGYADDFEWPSGWTSFYWKAVKGYGGQRKDGTVNANQNREVIWFSPACLTLEKKPKQNSLFDAPFEKVGTLR